MWRGQGLSVGTSTKQHTITSACWSASYSWHEGNTCRPIATPSESQIRLSQNIRLRFSGMDRLSILVCVKNPKHKIKFLIFFWIWESRWARSVSGPLTQSFRILRSVHLSLLIYRFCFPEYFFRATLQSSTASASNWIGQNASSHSSTAYYYTEPKGKYVPILPIKKFYEHIYAIRLKS